MANNVIPTETFRQTTKELMAVIDTNTEHLKSLIDDRTTPPALRLALTLLYDRLKTASINAWNKIGNA